MAGWPSRKLLVIVRILGLLSEEWELPVVGSRNGKWVNRASGLEKAARSADVWPSPCDSGARRCRRFKGAFVRPGCLDKCRHPARVRRVSLGSDFPDGRGSAVYRRVPRLFLPADDRLDLSRG